MTIQEAIKSGKPFSRGDIKEAGTWFMVGKIGFIHAVVGKEAALLADDILATDWEIKDDLP